MIRKMLYSGFSLLLLTARVHAEEPWWSFRPLEQPAQPNLAEKDAKWLRTPIDAFVLAKLRERGLSPAPEADRWTLIRRLYFDLVGLPPTPAEIDAFLNDKAPDSYEKLVDRLLASPHYGERWARHWMDVVHFAETHGHDQDRVRPNAWPYRDYLIESFNADKPYARFVQEQIAADALFPDQPKLIAALGFLAAGPWDESSLRDIREDSIDRQVGYYLDRDEMVTTVMSTFQSMTAHCARCHDHKFDPIKQTEYYQLQAVFAGVGRGERSFETDPKLHQKRTALKELLAAIERKDRIVPDQIAGNKFREELAVWEKNHKEKLVHWQPLEMISVASTEGSTLTKLPDGSIRSKGTRPERDTYIVTVKTAIKGIRAVKLEVLTDDGLPLHGPGRQDNGNLHLSEFQLLRSIPQKQPQAVALGQPISDYDQPGWTIQHAVDGNIGTAWGIYPQVGKSHQAIFPIKEPLGDGKETELIFQLQQRHGGGHLIGRFRITATTDNAGTISPLPETISTILATPADRRTVEQRQQLGLHVLRERTSAELATIPLPSMVYAAGRDFMPDGSHRPVDKPRAVHVLKRGEIRRPGAEVGPGSVSCLPDWPGKLELAKVHVEGERRAALARWLSDPKNPLTWRSAVNRIWHYHFGRGLVDTPNDFGKMGSQPTHPELLDWLACEFRDQGGSWKKMHRLLVTSAAYRQSSQHNAAYAIIDGDNRLLWRMQRFRLDAEQVRDAVLLVSDRLDRKMGGPSDQQFAMRPGIHVTPIVEYGKFNWDRPEGHRRSVYRFVFRTLPDSFIDCLDGCDASVATPARNTSITAPQSLALMNNEFMLVHALALAKVLEKQSTDRGEQIKFACLRVWGREPTTDEMKRMKEYAAKHGMPNLCRILFNANDFLFAD